MVDAFDDDALRGNETILVVEDDELVRDLVVEVMTDLGYRVLHACDAQDALEAIRRDEKIDLLFTDVVLSGPMSGIELTQLARRRRPDLKVLLTSGDRAFAAEVADFHLIAKPYRRHELALTLREAIEDPARA